MSSRSLLLRGVLFLSATACLGPWSSANGAEPTFRDLVRKYVAAQDGGVKPEPLPGLPEEVNKVLALEYTVLLRDGDKDEPVDAGNRQFFLGDQIRVRIKPLNRVYIYIFHEGASGQKVCLMPTAEETPPLAEAGQTLDLPVDGSVFEFTPPAGEEKLIVVATETPNADLAGMANMVFKKPDENLTAAEKRIHDELQERGKKILKSIDTRQAQGTRYREIFTSEALQKAGADMTQRGATRAILEEPPTKSEPSTMAVSATTKDSGPFELLVTIPLKSVASTGESD